ncbi:MAG: HAD family hydrolase [Anaerolineales bacterium]|nr:HAD family hydrolase [Anaerolineales bacterium]
MTMLQAVLFDLDDTLLGNDLDTFLPRYFALLGRYAERYMPREQFLQELMISTQAVIANTDTAVSNRDVFWNAFQQRTGLNPAEMEPFFDVFYAEQFSQLAAVTTRQPCVPELLQLCFKRALKVVIATNPLFPRQAIEQRLAWAGAPVTDYPYTLVTSYENMHATKPHLAYYHEILQRIEVEPAAALMVGDDWENDIAPAAAAGCATYWVPVADDPPPDGALVTGSGTLSHLYDLLTAGWPDSAVPPSET